MDKCKNCGKEVAKHGHQFCSPKCRMSGKFNPRWGGGQIDRECLWCGKHFAVRKHVVENGEGNCCSISCSRKEYNKNNPQTGENNPNWKGGVSKENYRYTKLRRERYPDKCRAGEKVLGAIKTGKLKRQPCEVCGSTENIHGHHDDYEKPLEVRWLCARHHRIEHGSTC
jgi:hypothetical protein